MPYITSADLVLAIGRERTLQMTDPDNTGRIDENVFGEARKASESKINGYLVKRFAVPIAAPVPEIVRQLAIDGTIYKLKSRGSSMATAEEIEEEKARILLLKDIATGIVALDVDPGPLKSTLVVDKTLTSTGVSISAKKTARDARRGTW